jgi:hypothetical protein
MSSLKVFAAFFASACGWVNLIWWWRIEQVWQGDSFAIRKLLKICETF